MMTGHAVRVTIGIILVLLIATVAILVSVVDEPLRHYAEQQANESLTGYQVSIGALTLHPLTLSVDLRDITVRQEAQPDPPLGVIPLVTVQARLFPLLTGTLAADVRVNGPALSITSSQIETAMKDRRNAEEPEDAPPWQDRLRDMAAFEGALYVSNGTVSYTGEPASEPVRIDSLELTARQLTNRPGRDELYPSGLRITARLLGHGELTIDGRADFLAKPHPGINADLVVRNLDIAQALAAAGQQHVPAKSGLLAMSGRIEYGPSEKSVTVDDVTVSHPKVEYVNEPSENRATEAAKETASMAMAWQDRVLKLFPFSIARAAIEEGEVTYRHAPDADPIHIGRLAIEARHIRNSESPPGEYPSELRIAAQLPDEAQLDVEGRADFFARPAPTIDAQLRVRALRLAGLKPVLAEYNVRPQDGLLDVTGRVKHSRKQTVVTVDAFLLEHAKIDYVHTAETKAKETKRVKAGAQAAKEVHQTPGLIVKVGHGKILNSEIGFINRSASPDYRVYLSEMNMDMDHFSNRLEEGTGIVKVTGKFMGSGPTVVTGMFRPEQPRPDFDLEVKIIKTNVKTLNDVLRAYGDIDVHGGMFAFFSELSVKDDRIEGYVKPLLKDVDVYDPDKDKDKALTRRIYKAVVGSAMRLLQNEPRDEVATETDLSGAVENPRAGTWQIIGNLVQNAFFKAILPGFEGRA